MNYPTHIVAIMGAVWNSEGKILLVRSPKRGWEPPGGQVENGEDILSALKREVMEESGIDIKIKRLIALYSNLSDTTKLMLTLEATAVGGTLQTSEESLEAGWFSPSEAIEKVTHPAQKQKLQDALNGSEGIIYRVYRTNPYELFETVML